MKFKDIKYIFVGLLLFYMQANASNQNERHSLPVKCDAVPSFKERLCYVTTNSSYGPYDDVVFYKTNQYNELILLGSQSGGVATFGGFGFSTGGRYMWISWAEEGHPFFEFYRTPDFLDNGIKAKTLNVISDYYFEDFETFNDKGEVVYVLAEDAFENCANQGEGIREKIDAKTSEKYCVKYINIIHQNKK